MVGFGGGMSRIPCLGLPVDGGPVGLDHNGTFSENRRSDSFPYDTKKALTDRSFPSPGWGDLAFGEGRRMVARISEKGKMAGDRRHTCYVPGRLPPEGNTDPERAIRRKGLKALVRPLLILFLIFGYSNATR